MWERLKATGRSIKHRRLTFALVVAFLAIGVVGGLYAIQSGTVFDGQTRAGDHNWWADIGGNTFCENCHNLVADDIASGPHAPPDLDAGDDPNNYSDCSYCHLPSGSAEHAAATAACTDCHDEEGVAVALATEAHNGILDTTSESATDASQTCQTCHTHIEVTMKIYADAPIPLEMGTPPGYIPPP